MNRYDQPSAHHLMKHRKLRIVWSVAWGVVAVVLVALWVRSYQADEAISFRWPGGRLIEFGHMSGMCAVITHDNLNFDFDGPVTDKMERIERIQRANKWRTGWHETFLIGPMIRDGVRIVSPYWLLVSAVAGAAFLSWIRWRFSLRTLIIVTTLVAVGLGTFYSLSR